MEDSAMFIFLESINTHTDLIKGIDTQSLVSIITAIIACISTYFVTKFNIYKPSKLKVSQQQFEKVYLPLFKLLCTNNTEKVDKKTALKYMSRMKTILFNNYELVFPQLHTLYNEFCDLIANNDDYNKSLNQIKYQISLDYEILKKKLGYPSLSAYKIFKRKTLKEKLRSIIGHICLIALFPGALILVIAEIYYSYSFIFIIIYIGLVMFSLYLVQLVNKLKD
jgi:hypothetical protein